MSEEKIKPRYWKTENGWACARPYPARYPFQKKDWWKHSGLRGFGTTKKQAFSDLESWENAADVVKSIY